ncbi:hypothetical protein CPB83DRAFT_898177 [Crepidotus variabilis]|uniref:Uncharacterized protein n=1 Tax=Crepidotus variabilis TaxID=179855 RepID=A0A9P6JKC8_9AGAR|nr:hypothetical protein CPB83DRAFT_898177 [Crepidotus variabilis]
MVQRSRASLFLEVGWSGVHAQFQHFERQRPEYETTEFSIGVWSLGVRTSIYTSAESSTLQPLYINVTIAQSFQPRPSAFHMPPPPSIERRLGLPEFPRSAMLTCKRKPNTYLQRNVRCALRSPSVTTDSHSRSMLDLRDGPVACTVDVLDVIIVVISRFIY